ncbi:hypothetical protein TanjilG_20318 [Lupinus angustifolius]|uniref:Auxin-induced protein n=1 Tax=Lupinus angustifolius TaxID=3871 RepID=A0A1J7IST9_LUPAN|nr:hypothetical protein TanjilG_20318 [Lupinus angustifolius]
MTKDPPTQELVTKDLHGNEWRFKHIFRGNVLLEVIVSPWKIEPAHAPPALNPLSMSRPKRHRPLVVSSSSDSSLLTRERASSKMSVDPLPPSGYPRVFQGNLVEGNKSDNSEKPIVWPYAVDEAEQALFRELWHMCAGPLVTVPRERELVFYFPQGHIEQVEASTNQVADEHIPVYDLRSKILCRVTNVVLKAEPDTDEVFAQVTLVAEPNDMTKDPPTQELVTKDLHGNEWRFKHIFRGMHIKMKFEGEEALEQRTNLTEFIVPYDQYMESLNINYTIGMHIKMKFEGEEALEQRCTGTIVGIEDVDPKKWPDSKWRSLKVKWDETSNILLPDRVSPWKIEPAHASPALNPLSMPRPKRHRPLVVPSSSNSSLLIRERVSSKVSVDHLPPSVYPTVLQGNLVEGNKSDNGEKSVVWPHAVDDEKIDDVFTSRKYGPEGWMLMGTHEKSSDILSSYGTNINLSSHPLLLNQRSHVANPTKKHLLDHEGKVDVMGSPWSAMPSSLSLNLLNSNAKGVQGGDTTNKVQGNLRHSAFGEYAMLQHGYKFEHPRGKLMMLPPPTTQYENPYSRELLLKSISPNTSEVAKPKDGNYKLFGFSLLSSPTKSGTSMSHRNVVNEPLGALHLPSHLYRTFENDQKSEHSRGSKPADVVVVADDQEKLLQTSQSHLKNVQPKPHSTSARSCTKVHKKGIALGRSVDLTKFSGYDELIAELDQLFEFGGELTSPKKDWLIVYTDNEGDMMLVGDDPWPEFCAMACKMSIYPKEDIQKMSPGTLSSKNEENQSASEGADGQETNCQPQHLASYTWYEYRILFLRISGYDVVLF